MRWPTQDPKKWHRAYAWRPVKCLDGTWVWLEPVERISYFSRDVPAFAPHTVFTAWCFRIPEDA